MGWAVDGCRGAEENGSVRLEAGGVVQGSRDALEAPGVCASHSIRRSQPGFQGGILWGSLWRERFRPYSIVLGLGIEAADMRSGAARF